MSIELQEGLNATYSSGDTICGKLNLNFTSSTTVTNIVVKLEGISFSKVPANVPQSKQETKYNDIKSWMNHYGTTDEFSVESHKFLYKTVTVFPPNKVEACSSESQQFKIPKGNHQFDFEFQIPTEAVCNSSSAPSKYSLSRFVSDKQSGIHYLSDAPFHLEGPLPPAVSDMPGFVSVKYFLKATVTRPSKLKSNQRFNQPIVFLPPTHYEPSIGPNTVLFIRNQINVWTEQPSPAYVVQYRKSLRNSKNPLSLGKDKLKSLFSRSSQLPDPCSVPLVLEMRYSKYFEPTQRLTLRLFVVCPGSLDWVSQQGYLSKIYVRNITFTLHYATRTRSKKHKMLHRKKEILFNMDTPVEIPLNQFVASLANSNNGTQFDQYSTDNEKSRLAAANSNESRGFELEIPSNIWGNAQIPGFVPPTFRTCNIDRSYSLEVTVGLSMTPDGEPNEVSLVNDIDVVSGLSLDAALPDHPGAFASGAASMSGDLPPNYSNFASQQQQQQQQSMFAPYGSNLPSYGETMGTRQEHNQQNGRRTYQLPESYYTDRFN